MLARKRIELKVTHRRCPCCKNRYQHDIVVMLKTDALCIVCGKHRLSEFEPVLAPPVSNQQL